MRYVSENDRINALKSFISSYRYFALMNIIDDLKFSLDQLEAQDLQKTNLASNIVNNFCSNNMTFISKYQLKSFIKSRFLKKSKKNNHENNGLFSNSVVREINLKRGIRNFRNFCSWSGGYDSFELLSEYLYSSLFIQRGIDYFFHQSKKNSESIIGCENNICRKVSDELGFNFPLAIASVSVESDFKNIYCEYFYEEKLSSKTTRSTASQWRMKESREELVRDMFYFLKISGIGDNNFNYVTNKIDLDYVVESSVEKFFNTWSDSQLSSSETNLTYEEDISLSLVYDESQNNNKPTLIVNIDGGVLDRVYKSKGKIGINAKLKFSEKFLSWWLRTKYETLPANKTKVNHLKKVLKIELDERLPRSLAKVPLYSIRKSKFHDLFFNFLYDHFSNQGENRIDVKKLARFDVRLNFAPSALKKIYNIKKFQALTEEKKKPY